jgi:hypothetical protein
VEVSTLTRIIPGVEAVDAGVDVVADELLGLLDKALDIAGVVRHHHAVLGGVRHLQRWGLRD